MPVNKSPDLDFKGLISSQKETLNLSPSNKFCQL